MQSNNKNKVTVKVGISPIKSKEIISKSVAIVYGSNEGQLLLVSVDIEPTVVNEDNNDLSRAKEKSLCPIIYYNNI